MRGSGLLVRGVLGGGDVVTVLGVWTCLLGSWSQFGTKLGGGESGRKKRKKRGGVSDVVSISIVLLE